MKFIKLNQLIVNQEGKKEDVGDIYIIPSEVSNIKQIWDKHDVVISECCLITLKNQHTVVVRGEIKDIVGMFEESFA